MAGPGWSDDDPADAAKIAANAKAITAKLIADASLRLAPDLDEARRWHDDLYYACSVPSADYVAHFRGDANYPDLVDYEVGVGPILADGYPERMGVPAALVAAELSSFITKMRDAVAKLDAVIPVGQAPQNPAELRAVLTLAALAHGEWVRLHPFANGNGRTARLWANSIALRYGLRPFLSIKPRPGSIDYGRAARESMGRPPTFTGNHGPTVALFASMIAASLGP